MKSRALRFFTIAVFAVLAMTVQANAQQIITFNAPNSGTSANQGTEALGINLFGAITGYVTDSSYGTHGYVRTPDGQFTEFDAPGADPIVGCTCPSAINDLGVVTGYYIDTNGVSHGFLRSPEGKFTTFDVTGAGGYGSFPIALNLEGAVVGYYTDSNYSFHAFLRGPHGTFTTWIGPDACTGNGSEGCYGSGATNINAFGTIAGGFEDNSGNFVHHSFVRNAKGKLKTFDVPGAGTGSYQGAGCPGCALAACGRTTENARAVTRCAAPERWCHPQASQAIESPDEGTARHPARQRAQNSRKHLPCAIFQLARRTRSQQLAQNQAQVERSYMDQLPLQNVLPPS